MKNFFRQSIFEGFDPAETRVVASANQVRYVKAELAGVGTYMIPVGHYVEGTFSEATFRASAAELVRRHDALRTRFEVSDGHVHAFLSASPRFQISVTRLSDESLSKFREWALPLIFSNVAPSEPGSLIRFLAADYGGRWRFSIAGHHAITDGVSRGVLNKELIELCSGKTPAPAGSYYDYASNPKQADNLPDIAASVDALPKPVRIIGDGISDDKASSAGQFVERNFGPLRPRVLNVAKGIGATKFSFLSAVYALGLRGYMADNGVSTFFQSAGRRSSEAPNTIVGPFSNTLPLDLSVDPGQHFSDFVRDLLGRSRDMLALETTPFLDEAIAAGKAPSVAINMFPPEAPIQSDKFVVGPREFLDRRTEFDVNLVWSEDADSLNARVFYNASQITEDRARLFLDFQARLLTAALASPDRTCREILKEARADKLAVSHIQTRQPEPKRRLHEDFFDTARRTPETIAIVTSSEKMTYGDLAARAQDIARGLQDAALAEGERVAIFAQRHPTTVAAILGVSSYGASFALIDATYPGPRIRHMLDRLGSRLVIEAGAKLPPEISADVELIDPSAGPDTAPYFTGPPRQEAYHLFTSGTTGAPKLTSHPDKTLQRFIAWQSRTLDLRRPVATLMMAGLAHDPTMRDIFLPLNNGGLLAIPTPDEMADPFALRRLLKDAGCNVLRLSPSSGRLLATEMPASDRFDQVRAIFWGGERLPIATVDQWRSFAPEARQFNVFGTTETPQAFLIHEISGSGRVRRDVPIGRPLPWNGVRLIDDDQSPVSEGEVGQIVAELADSVVGVDQGSKKTNKAGSVHFTGDLGFQDSAGEVFFAGRRDSQIKINGYRVELGEIETTVEALAGVERATAMLSENRIVLFVQSDAPEVTEASLRLHLYRMLPSYMLPARTEVMPAFPMTPNGKVDGEKLLASMPVWRVDAGNSPSEGPQGPSETAISDVFSRYSTRTPGRDDALLDLGADSLSAIEARFDLERLGFVLPDDWLGKSVRELAHGQRAPLRNKAGYFSRFMRSSRIDSFILLRALAIFVVVAFHSGFRLSGGASIALFALAGFSFAKVQLPGILREDSAGRVWALIVRILVPMLPMLVVYYALYTYLGEDLHISAFLFFKNLASLADALGLYPGGGETGIVWIWFLHVYLQIFVLVGITLESSKVRQALRSDTWRSLAIAFVASELLGLAAIAAVGLQQGSVSAAGLLFYTSPTAIFPFLLVGAMAAVSETAKRTLLTFLMAFAHLGTSLALYPDHAEMWWIVVLLLCVFVPYVSLPQIVSRVVVSVSAYSLMIYLTHQAVFIVLYKFIGGSDLANAASIVIQILSGVMLGLLLRPLIQSAEGLIKFRAIARRAQKNTLTDDASVKEWDAGVRIFVAGAIRCLECIIWI